MKTLKLTISVVCILFLSVSAYSQNKTVEKIENTKETVKKTNETVKEVGKLFKSVFGKKKKNKKVKNKREVTNSPYYIEFTIGDEYFFLDGYNDPDWVGLHAEKDRENDYLSVLRITAMKTGYLNKKGKSGAIDFVMAPKDRHVTNKAYTFNKGESAYAPLVSFYFTLGDTNYASSKPVFVNSENSKSYTHSISGQITLTKSENKKDGIVEGDFRLEGIVVKKDKKTIAEGKVMFGKFRMPISIGQRMQN
ncbi:hypothetical protein [Hwangdonia lutea]|uniref:Uncharacterized protein n=1 Tax=Hwangdonia lutea TaxID=3075823 RepID=A0AA97EP84_9FLAO|nr:hypothetical protein [Hwangdonia sp. SCSIO 19198]WOD43705.1 hypothetical protein RNZ46_00215 [Hwangdonia sp. SCSIO 19198]